MAYLLDRLHTGTTMKKKKQSSGQQRLKEELEREVVMLQKMLDHEQKVGEILERAKLREEGSALGFPNILPSKMKELLAELAMVENEITRLESQISQLQTHLKEEKEANKASRSKHAQSFLDHTRYPSPLNQPNHSNPSTKGISVNNRQSFETKALHFISKAIKGDYRLSDFSDVSRLTLQKDIVSYQKENQFHGDHVVVGNQENVPKRSSILKPPSPSRDSRHITPKKERNVEVSWDLPPKVVSVPTQQSEEEIVNKWSPNKLSENIMKCLIFIFMRLLRTSRTMEIEKSGPISRAANFSLSFRAEPCLNSKASLLLQKESRQQDPYGIFNMEESVPRDIGCYKNLVIFTSSSLEPKCISSSSYIPLLQKLKTYMNGLQKVDLRNLTFQQKLAFWINMYNACVMHGFLQYGVPSSSEKLLSLMKKATLNIGGSTISAHTIEHFILRKHPDSIIEEIYGKDDEEAKFRGLYGGLESTDPNVTFALCCGTRSSPAVRIFSGDGVVNELERSKLEYLQASIVVKSTRKIGVPELLVRNMQDFACGQDMDKLVEWVCLQLPTSCSLRKSIIDCFKGSLVNGKVSSINVDKIPYDFEFQYLLPM